MTLSERVLADNADVFQAMLSHPFVAAIQTDTLKGQEFDAYLVYEGAFVETAIAIFGHMLVKCDGMHDKRRIIGILDALANEQIAYFDRVFAGRGIDPTRYPIPEAVRAFDRGMLEIAERGELTDIASAMFAAEWMYLTWCSGIDAEAVADADLRGWISLHAQPSFRNQAQWLKDKVDKFGAASSDADWRRCSKVFRHATKLEIAFHDAPMKVRNAP